MSPTQYLRSRERVFWPVRKGTYRRGDEVPAPDPIPAHAGTGSPEPGEKPRMARADREAALAVAALWAGWIGARGKR